MNTVTGLFPIFKRISSPTKTILFLFLVAVFTILLLIHLRLYPYAFDDSYIHIRIVEHLSDFGEPYFNLGEPVKASSSSGWIIFLFLVDIVFRNSQVLQLPLLIGLINTLMTFSGAILYTLLFCRLSENTHRFINVQVLYIHERTGN